MLTSTGRSSLLRNNMKIGTRNFATSKSSFYEILNLNDERKDIRESAEKFA